MSGRSQLVYSSLLEFAPTTDGVLELKMLLPLWRGHLSEVRCLQTTRMLLVKVNILVNLALSTNRGTIPKATSSHTLRAFHISRATRVSPLGLGLLTLTQNPPSHLRYLTPDCHFSGCFNPDRLSALSAIN